LDDLSPFSPSSSSSFYYSHIDFFFCHLVCFRSARRPINSAAPLSISAITLAMRRNASSIEFESCCCNQARATFLFGQHFKFTILFSFASYFLAFFLFSSSRCNFPHHGRPFRDMKTFAPFVRCDVYPQSFFSLHTHAARSQHFDFGFEQKKRNMSRIDVLSHAD
jgi:hypothetical protein